MKQRNLLIGFIILLILAAGAVVLAVRTNTASEPAVAADANTLVNKVTASTISQYPSVDGQRNGSSDGNLVYKANNYDFAVILDRQAAANTLSSTQANNLEVVKFNERQTNAKLPQDFANNLSDAIKANGFTAVDKPAVDAMKYLGGNVAQYAFYEANSVICMTSNYTTGQSISLACAPMSAIEAQSKAAQPFAEKYASAKAVAVNELAMGAPAVATNVQNGPYQHAIVIINAPSANAIGRISAGSFFYRTSTTGEWNYVSSSQEGIGCADLSGNAAKALSDICRPAGAL